MDYPSRALCHVILLGQVDYDTAWQLQNRLAEQVYTQARPPVLLLLEHPHVYTLGRRSEASNLLWDEAKLAARGVVVRSVDRGGDITYHGPGQLVGYPIIPLAQPGWKGDRIPQADYVGFVRRLEETLIRALASYGMVTGQRAGLTGVWVMADVWGRCTRCDPRQKPQPVKIASIGVKVDIHGITRHGFALNVSPDRDYWSGIVACGLPGVTMADLADFLDPAPAVADVGRSVAEVFGQVFDFQMQWLERLD